MSLRTRQAFFRNVFLVSWGMLTLVLVFCVCLLVREMITRGDNPFETPKPAPPAAPPVMGDVRRTEEIVVYFADREALKLRPEMHAVTFGESTVENCRRALDALIAGPRDTEAHTPVLSKATKVRALYLLEDGELVLDFSRELLAEHRKLKSASFEALLVYGVVQTLTQSALRGPKDRQVEGVRFLMEGAPPPFPAHLDLSRPVTPDRRWVAP